MRSPDTLPALLLDRAARIPDRVIARVTLDGEETAITYEGLARHSSALAGALAAAGVRAGDVVPLAFPTSPEYLYAIFGAHLLGAAIAPVPPLTVFKEERTRFHAERLSTVAACCGSNVAVVSEQAASHLVGSGLMGGIDLLPIETLCGERETSGFEQVDSDPNRTALVQFSSGSTASPKGARIRFRNIVANCEAVRRRVATTRADSIVSFLPLFHDFGLFAGILYPFLWDMPAWLFDTAEFIRRPSFWLKTMSRTRATMCPAPQFVYEVALHRIRDRDLEGVDLSAWRISYDGGEPIHAHTLRAFNARFAPFGLSPSVVLPSYGMAESTLAMAVHPAGSVFETDLVSRDALVGSGAARPAEQGELPLEIVSCGPALDGVELAILDEAGAEKGEREVGEIGIRGDCVADEYVVGPGTSWPLVQDGWFRTGDLGYLANGRVFVTGRAKDLIIRGGQNYYPQDIERAIEALDGARPNGVVAFGCSAAEHEHERLVVVVERDSADASVLASLPERARRAVFDAMGIMIDDVVLQRRGWIPKTTSAKLQRARARAMYLEAQP